MPATRTSTTRPIRVLRVDMPSPTGAWGGGPDAGGIGTSSQAHQRPRSYPRAKCPGQIADSATSCSEQLAPSTVLRARCSEQLGGRDEAGDAVVGRDGRGPSVAVAGAEIQRAVGAGDDVADPAEAAGEEPLGRRDAVGVVRVEPDAQQVLAGERADEEVLPEAGD